MNKYYFTYNEGWILYLLGYMISITLYLLMWFILKW